MEVTTGASDIFSKTTFGSGKPSMGFIKKGILIGGIFFSFIAGGGATRAEENPIKGHLDEPVFVKMPRKTTVENKRILSLYFRMDKKACEKRYGKRYYSSCRANLRLAGKTIPRGISMVPEIPGEWRWDYDYTIKFTPDSPWVAGQEYKVVFDKSVFPEHLIVDTYAYKFRSNPFRVSPRKMKFFQDPDNPARKVIATHLDFNYPVNKKSLEDRLAFSFVKRGNNKKLSQDDKFPFEIIYSADATQADLTTALPLLPDKEKFLSLVVDTGVEPKGQKRPSIKTFRERVRVPSLENYYQVKSAKVALVKNRKYGTDQVLTLDTNVKAEPEVIAKNLEVYLLPEFHPVAKRDPENKKPYRWQAANEVTDSILKYADPLDVSLIPQSRKYAATHSLKLDTAPGRFLYVKLKGGVKTFGGFVLAEDYMVIAQVPFFPKELSIMQSGGLLALSGEKKISIVARGLDRIKFEVARVLPRFISHLVTQTRGNFDSPYFTNYNFDRQHIADMKTEEISLFRDDDRKAQFTSFDFSSYLERGKKGLFFLKAFGQRGKNLRVRQDNRFILVTDLGFIIKRNADKSREVFVQSIATGKPVSGAQVQVLGNNGKPVFTVLTGDEGRASVPNLSGISRDKLPVAVVVSKDDDLSFMAYNRRDRGLNFSGFPVSGTHFSQTGMKAYLFSDRGIYRPGDLVHFGLIVKPRDWDKDLEGIPLQLDIIDSRGIRIKKETIKLAANGYQEYEFQTRETSPTGRYHAHLYISNDGKRGSLLNSTSVRVEEFLPDRLKIRADFNVPRKKGWVSPKDLKVKVNLKNLYGTPATNRRIKGTLTLSPGAFSFKEFSEYQFFNGLNLKNSQIQESLPDEKSDQNGDAEFALDLKRYGKTSAYLSFRGEGFEAGGGRSVAVDADLLVSPLKFVVGHKTASNLAYLKNDRNHTLEWIAVDSDLNKVSGQKLILSRVRKDYISTLVKRNGKLGYESVPKERILDTRQVEIGADGLKWKLDASHPGDYVLILSDLNGLDVSRVEYSVAGEANLAGRLDTRAELKVKLNKPYYQAGEEIEMNIVAPYTGAGLITIESDRVYAHHWFLTDKTDTLQKIKVPDDFEGNGFVNVTFTRAMGSPEIYMSPLTYAVVPFTANIEKRRVEIDLQVPDKARPGNPLSFKVATDRPSRIVVFAVDEGILQVAQYKTPRPLDYFLKGRALDVDTTQILDLIMPEYSAVRESLNFGGGMSAVGGKHLNPFRRKTDAPVVFWSGILGADRNPQTVTYEVPSYFNGTLRVMAVAVAAGGVGASARKSTVKGDYVISPNVPLFVAPGDTFEVTATLANNLEGSGEQAQVPFSVSLSKHLSLVEPAEKVVSIPEGREGLVRFRVKANEVLGSASIDFVAGGEAHAVRYQSTLSVRPPVPKATLLTSGYFSDGVKTVALKRERYQEFAKTEVSLSALPSGLIQGLIDFLENNVHSCTEQTISRAFPPIALLQNPDYRFDDEKIKNNLKRTVDRLRERQTSEGGFGNWTGNEAPSLFASVYAMDFLTLSREKGFPVPTDLTQRGLVYLKDVVNQSIRSKDDARAKAYGIYILTRNGEVTTNYITHLMSYISSHSKWEWDNDLTMVYLAGAFKLMKQDDLAEDILEKFVFKKEDFWPRYSYYNSLVKYSQYVVLLARHFPDRLKNMDREIIFKIANYIGETLYNSLSSSYAIQALNEYTLAVGNQESVNLLIEQEESAGSFTPLDTTGVSVKRGRVDGEVSSFRFKGSGKHGLFYQVANTGFDKALPEKPIVKGMEITREFQNLKGEVVTKAKLGEELDVVITLHSHENKWIDNIALVDLLPGGFDLVLDKAGEGSTLETEFIDKREDRVVAYVSVQPKEKSFRYRIRPTNKGEYTIPPPYAESMYDLRIQARGLAKKIHVE
ncbi:MAG: alpha-2-macroglobulin family protein [Candidatus Nitronauta litoralis]|uniref:Alpha-2-macroglobulin family protein n=1 Tax=Candidatus Nitronauta litoralis TaxID=2705533 RepID=A0A7T0BZ27_9BACT|nr:MAG: alpha-2-macroglobulin family protein [Candidatus Nitronauta litoralis]